MEGKTSLATSISSCVVIKFFNKTQRGGAGDWGRSLGVFVGRGVGIVGWRKGGVLLSLSYQKV